MKAELKIWNKQEPTREYVKCEAKETTTPRAYQSASGYGAKVPTPYMVRYDNKWRRVYSCQFGNSGTLYIGKPGQWEATVENIIHATLIIEVSPLEPRASICLANGESVIGSEYESDIMDCTASGDCQPACEYVRDNLEIEYRIVARNKAGEYENRLATDKELRATAKAIYFESNADFSDMGTTKTYLIWEAACGLESERESE